MTQKRRLKQLEQKVAPEEPLMTFKIAIPPEGCTQQEYDEWARQRQAECDARGTFCFTLNLGDCIVNP